jgi:hypothetical protein
MPIIAVEKFCQLLYSRCLEKGWNLTAEQSGIDFNQLLVSLGLQVGVIQRKKLSAMDRRYLNIFHIDS